MSEEKQRQPFQWTLGQIQKMNLTLECACEAPGCGWFGQFNLDALIEKFGVDYALPEYGPGFPCEQCGSDRVKFQVAYLHPPADEPQK